jgi:hypothetical protein
MFIKIGDGKITNVLDEEQLTEEQKKSVKKAVKQTNTQTDASIEKKSGS